MALFEAVEGFRKADLLSVAEELGLAVPARTNVAQIKGLILESEEYRSDPIFVKEMLKAAIEDRQMAAKKAENERQNAENERQFELEKMRLEHELEMTKLQFQGQDLIAPNALCAESFTPKRKFTLPKLEFRQFDDDLKDWLPFWSQFQHIDKDNDIALEDKFQYLIQATVSVSRARELIESFPPTGDNYSKAVEGLKSRFGREDLLVEVYVRELLKLIINVQMKGTFSLTSLYDKLETYIRALDTLGVTTDKCASILYPMVESCFPEEFLKAYSRSTTYNTKLDAKERLDSVMAFLKAEVEGEARINLAMDGFGLLKTDDTKMIRKKKTPPEANRNNTPSTAAALLTTTSVKDAKKTCVFCDGKHASSNCFSAQDMTLTQRQNILKEKRCCFNCLVPGHVAKRCKNFLKCLLCGKKHVPIMCEMLGKQSPPVTSEKSKPSEKDINMTNFNQTPKVFLQTLIAKLVASNKEMEVRLLIDTASQRSYILDDVAKRMYPPLEEINVAHSLFGGVTTSVKKHKKYEIKLARSTGNFSCKFEVLGQDVICDKISPVNNGPWIKELKEMKIHLTDVKNSYEPVHILIGADTIGQLLTGRQKILSNGMIATETFLGWTLMGKIPQPNNVQEDLTLPVISLFVREAEIADLWRLDLIGITDPLEKKLKLEKDLEAKEHFLETVKINEEGRYEVHLPWNESELFLPNNLSLAKRRLEKTTFHLKSKHMYNEYEKIILSWLEEGIIEEVLEPEFSEKGHYLPHRPVIKVNSNTTPIRPVFDASARMPSHPSLNQCLQCGPNLLELIPAILLRFRERKIGISSDIKKAFLQISDNEKDQDFLRFLWWKNVDDKTYRIFKHTKVVFGLKCSPFLLCSVINYHIENDENSDENFKNKLLQSFYVDNSLTSVDTVQEMEEFKRKSTELMHRGSFELRSWEYTNDADSLSNESTILGLIWNRNLDTVKVNMSWVEEICLEKITKRIILSVAHRVFDPIGYTAPVMLCPKLMLQKAWRMGISWDEEILGDLRSEFLMWFKDLKILEEIQIPRWIQINDENLKNCSLHTFCDASKDAYAAVVFLRIEEKDEVKLSLLSAKSRITPLKGGTIPRLELTAALVGARLANSTLQSLGWKDMEQHYWSDSTTVLAWITQNENWSVYVRNRTEEIRKLTDSSSWHFVDGRKNPADLPSRGCSSKILQALKWWEGPSWLKEANQNWTPVTSMNFTENMEDILKEKSKSTCLVTKPVNTPKTWWCYMYFSKYENMVRMVGWIKRFIHNCRTSKENRNKGELTKEEFGEAEKNILKIVQEETFEGEDDKRLKSLSVFKDEDGLLKVKTQIVYRKIVINSESPFFFRQIMKLSQDLYVSTMKRIHIVAFTSC